MKNWFRKSFWIICCLTWTGLAFSTALSPSLQIAAPDHDFGEVDEGMVISHNYWIKNSGAGSLEIQDVQPG
jgi:hypothetical protein